MACRERLLKKREVEKIKELLCLPQYRDLSPKQIVPNLADQGIYFASESTMFRVLRRDLQKHREPSKPREKRKPKELLATRPNQVWSWDIPYLPSPVRGRFYFLYLFLDVFSGKILSFDVHLEESQEHASLLMGKAHREEGVDRDQLTFHSDNGGPMKDPRCWRRFSTFECLPSAGLG